MAGHTSPVHCSSRYRLCRPGCATTNTHNTFSAAQIYTAADNCKTAEMLRPTLLRAIRGLGGCAAEVSQRRWPRRGPGGGTDRNRAENLAQQPGALQASLCVSMAALHASRAVCALGCSIRVLMRGWRRYCCSAPHAATSDRLFCSPASSCTAGCQHTLSLNSSRISISRELCCTCSNMAGRHCRHSRWHGRCVLGGDGDLLLQTVMACSSSCVRNY